MGLDFSSPHPDGWQSSTHTNTSLPSRWDSELGGKLRNRTHQLTYTHIRITIQESCARRFCAEIISMRYTFGD